MIIDSNNKICSSGYSGGKVKSFFHPTIMGKTEWFKANSYRDWAYRAEDFELWCRTEHKSCFYSIEKPLLFYREFSVPMLNKTIESLKMQIMIYRRYKEYGRSLFWAIKGVIITFFKIIVYIIFGAVGKMDYLISKRTRVKLSDRLLLTEDDLKMSVKDL